MKRTRGYRVLPPRDDVHIDHAKGCDTVNDPTPYVFVVGCPRSGTTLLQRMLDAHPDLAVANDTHFIPRTLDRIEVDENLRLTSELVEFVRSYHRFKRLGIPNEAVDNAADKSATFPDFVSELYKSFAAVHGKRLAGEKTPDYVKRIPLLNRLFPDARFLHIIRDGRDVALSTLAWAHETKGPGRFELWKKHPIAVCALWWSRQVGRGRTDGLALGADKYYEVLYEELVHHTDSVLDRIADFLDLPFSNAMSRFHENKIRDDPGLSPKKAWLPATPNLRNWRTNLTDEDVALFDALAGELLAQLGYERSAADRSAQTSLTAEQCRMWWTKFVDNKSRRGKRKSDVDCSYR